ncbi:hypothetical protein SUSP_002240 [Sulfurospirillum sp. 'SP']|nr:hypothetical protein [Sulfurospirillum sp. 'SP']WNY99822.1 hypothetical protein SUSP_002240 [Sulfurospirillum sp. 'SP']
MRFLTGLGIAFFSLYLILAVHALSVSDKNKAKEIEAISSHVKDTKLSVSFKSNEYQRFVYAK